MRRILDMKDVPNGTEAEAYCTLDGRRYNLFYVMELSADLKKKKDSKSRLGTQIKGHKSTSVEGTGKMKMYGVSSLFKKKMIEYAKTGVDFFFDIQVTKEDPGTSIGRETIFLYECNIDNATIVNINIDDETLTYDVDFTFESSDMPETYTELEGM